MSYDSCHVWTAALIHPSRGLSDKECDRDHPDDAGNLMRMAQGIWDAA